ncbi:glycosyltransferase family 4 protein [Enterococcus sp. LJL51]|uniref:glycosyltransferase family 4 protein n=1 Tax=Enterococcus sp. LJL51 TaxID=3416656 RepID=UPI003CF53257
MFSKADTVQGQGVGSAYEDLIQMWKKLFSDDFDIHINKYSKSDISHYHTINPLFFLATFQKKKRGVQVGHVHFIPETLEGSLKLVWPLKVLFVRYLLWFYRRMDILVVVNPEFIQKLEVLGFNGDSIKYIPNFVNSKEFYKIVDIEERTKIKAELGFTAKDFIILGVGQIQSRKGIADFIKLAEENPTLQFVWTGGFSFGRMTDGYGVYKQIVEKPPANLYFPGIVPRTEMNSYYNSADLFLLPSYAELFPMSILEAFNCGVPVMLRDLELYAGILEGFYMKAADFDDMNRQLKDRVGLAEKIQIYQEKSIEASKKYSEVNIVKEWMEFYKYLVR